MEGDAVEKFSIPPQDFPIVIPPGGSHDVLVTCHATAYDTQFFITLTISSNDPDEPSFIYYLYYVIGD